MLLVQDDATRVPLGVQRAVRRASSALLERSGLPEYGVRGLRRTKTEQTDGR